MYFLCSFCWYFHKIVWWFYFNEISNCCVFANLPYIPTSPFINFGDFCKAPSLLHPLLLSETQEHVVFKEHLDVNICSTRIVNVLVLLYELVSFACVSLNDVMFVCVIWQILATWLVSKFFASQKFKAFLLFFRHNFG